ncbi:hypothetical protein ACFLRF_00975 [Candidatus Altiarchaeota archaeon]
MKSHILLPCLIVSIIMFSGMGCLEPQQSLDLVVQKNNYENIIDIRNIGDNTYTECKFIVNQNWTFLKDEFGPKEELILNPLNFSSKDGSTPGRDHAMKAFDIYCTQGYFGGVFED